MGGTKVSGKFAAAYDKCFGADYVLEDLAAEANEADSDANGDGLPDVFQKAEVCFHNELGWIEGEGLNAQAIKDVMASLADKGEYERKVDECAGWSLARKKRSAEEEEEQGGVMLIRKLREAQNQSENKPKKGGKGKGGKKGKGKKNGVRKKKGKKA